MTDVQTSIIIPAYNEEAGLPIVLPKVLRLVDDSYEVIVVDDGSTDGTAAAALSFPVRLFRHEVNQGKGAALKTGIANARGANIIWIDSDDTYPVEMIPRMVEILGHHDMVICTRKYGTENIPRFNRLGNWLFHVMISGIYGFSPSDPCTGLYGVRRDSLLRMRLSSKRFAIESEIAIKASRMKLKVFEIPIAYKKRLGATKLNAIKVGFQILAKIIALLFWRPEEGDVNQSSAAGQEPIVEKGVNDVPR